MTSEYDKQFKAAKTKIKKLINKKTEQVKAEISKLVKKFQEEINQIQERKS